MSSSRRLWVVAVAVGIGLGLFALLADGIVGGRELAMLGNIASPWGLAAFVVGLQTTSAKRGAIAGTLALVVGIAVYYPGGVLRSYVIGQADLVWISSAFVAGPVMGWCGAAVAARRSRPPILAVAAPSAMLVAEALFLAYDRRVWLWNFGAETYRFFDIGVMVLLFLGGLALPLVFEKDRHRRLVVYLIVATAGIAGAVAFTLIRELVVAIA